MTVLHGFAWLRAPAADGPRRTALESVAAGLTTSAGRRPPEPHQATTVARAGSESVAGSTATWRPPQLGLGTTNNS